RRKQSASATEEPLNLCTTQAEGSESGMEKGDPEKSDKRAKKPGKSTGWTLAGASTRCVYMAYIRTQNEPAPPNPVVRPRPPVQRAIGAGHGHPDRRIHLCEARRANADRQRRGICRPVVRRMSGR